MYTLKQASEKLGISVVTLRRYIKSGKLKAQQVGKEYRIAEEDVLALLTKSSKPTEPEELIKYALETNSEYRWLFQRADDLSAAEKLLRERGNEKRADEAAKDVLIFSYTLKPRARQASSESAYGRFAPRAIFKDEDGNDVPRPDPAWIDAKLVEYAKERVNRVKNPVSKAVYCDLIYEFSKGADKAIFGKQAAKEYLLASDAELALDDDDRVLSAQGHILRSLEIGFALNDTPTINVAVKYATSKMQDFVAANKPRIVHELAEELLQQVKKLPAKTAEALPTLIDDSIAFYVNQAKNEHLARSYMELKLKLPGIKGNADKQRGVKREMVDSYLREAKSKDESGLVAAHFMAEALKVGAGVITEQESQLLRSLIEQANLQGQNEMKSFSFDVEIKNEDIKRYVNAVLVDDIEKSFQRIAIMPGMIPSLENAREQAEEMAKKYPMQHLFTRTTLQDGRVVSLSPGGLDFNDDHVLNKLGQDIQFHGVWLGFLLDELKNRGVDAAAFAAYLSQRDFFNNEAFPAVSEAVSLYFDGKYYSAVVSLLPQIEQLLRINSRKLGKATMRSRDNGEQRVIYVKEALDNFKEIMPPDMYHYFALILWDKRGLGLRDTATHGLLEYSSANKQQANLLMHLLLILAAFELKEVPAVKKDEK